MALSWAKEPGCNYARLADRLGLLMGEEIPVYWTVDFAGTRALGSAKQQLAEAMTHDRNTLSMLGKIRNIRGLSLWILTDFRSPKRVLPGFQDGWNRKDLISSLGIKKMAFFTLRKFYDRMALQYPYVLCKPHSRSATGRAGWAAQA